MAVGERGWLDCRSAGRLGEECRDPEAWEGWEHNSNGLWDVLWDRDAGFPCDDARVLCELGREKMESWEDACEDDVEAWDGGADLREFSGRSWASISIKSVWEDRAEDSRQGEGVDEDGVEESLGGEIKETSEPDGADTSSSREDGMEESEF